MEGKKTIRNLILNIVLAVFLIAFIYSVWQIWLIQDSYKQEQNIHDQVLEFRPEESPKEQNPDVTPESSIIVNPSIADAQENINKDIVGWITIPNTKIDYPYVQTEDNSYYLNKDINKNDQKAGTLFVDFRCSKDFSSFNTIIYGHHMKNDSMFGTLKKFRNKTFFDTNKTGKIYIQTQTYIFEIFAYIVVDATDLMIYNTIYAREDKVKEYLEYVEDKATHFRDIGVKGGDSIITLSTCGYDYKDARLILLARVK